MRLATLDAAMRRGCVWPIRRGRSPGLALSLPRPMDSAILGSWVVLPEPVSPHTMTTWWSAMARAISSRLAETGSDSGKLRRSADKAGGVAEGPRHGRRRPNPRLSRRGGRQRQLGDLAAVLVVPGHAAGIAPGGARHGPRARDGHRRPHVGQGDQHADADV